MDKEREEEIKRLYRIIVDVERQLVNAKQVADELQGRLNQLDKRVEALFDGVTPVTPARSVGPELDDVFSPDFDTVPTW